MYYAYYSVASLLDGTVLSRSAGRWLYPSSWPDKTSPGEEVGLL
jgi:hypothetical protein